LISLTFWLALGAGFEYDSYMCSVTEDASGRGLAPSLGMLIGHAHEVGEQIAAALARATDGTALTGVHADEAAGQVRELLALADRARAAAAVLTGVVDDAASARLLIEGGYASTARFLESEAGLSPGSATAFTARARDLRDAAHAGDPRLRTGWLSGTLSDDKVRELTLGVRGAVRHLPAADRDAVTSQALDLLLPLAPTHTVAELKRAVRRLRFVLDPDGVRRAELDAYCEQSLTCVPVGHQMRILAYLDPEAAAALMTVLEQRVQGWLRDDDLAPEERLPDGVTPDSAQGRHHTRARLAHLRALALGEVMTGLLDRGEAGTHHGVRPHTVLHVEVRDLLAGLGGELTMPGHDEPTLISSDTVRRILCDTDLTHILITALAADRAPEGSAATGPAGDSLPDLLRRQAVEVLYVGRAQRTAPPRLRRALEARDRHCQAPGCQRSPRRCHAHHVAHWEHGGDTSIANTLLLCERHHRALHSGQLTITRQPDRRPTQSGYFHVHPPDRTPTP
jgi:hypothetical protein